MRWISVLDDMEQLFMMSDVLSGEVFGQRAAFGIIDVLDRLGHELRLVAYYRS